MSSYAPRRGRRILRAGATLALVLGPSTSLAACGGPDTDAEAPRASTPSNGGTPLGPRISGHGYSFEAPRGWSDVTSAAHQRQQQVDSAATDGRSGEGFTTSLNIVVTNSTMGAQPSTSQLNQLQRQLTSQMPTQLGPQQVRLRHLRALPRTTVAGSAALHQEANVSASGTRYYLTQYVIPHDANVYIVTFSFTPGMTAQERRAITAPVLGSWSWT